MSTLKLNLPYMRDREREAYDEIPERNPMTGQAKSKWTSDAELTENYIAMAVQTKYPQGLKGQLRRVYGRIQRKMDSAIKEGADEIDLEVAEKDFLRKIFQDEELAIPANVSHLFTVLEDEIESACALKNSAPIDLEQNAEVSAATE
jgi:hypothetical protein